MKMSRIKRSSGVLLPLFSLPSPYGIGTLGREAYRFVDYLHEAGQSYWQLLPMNPTGYGDSPYMATSAFAGNPYFIDLDDAASLLGLPGVPEAGLSRDVTARVDYGAQYVHRLRILDRMIAEGAGDFSDAEFRSFKEREHAWLEDYARFEALRRRNACAPWQEWKACEVSDSEVDTVCFEQYLFFRQYGALRRYASEMGVGLIGDMPLYLSTDSADVWSAREDFYLDERGYPTEVSGVPPDLFSEDGQRWGTPLYRWHKMKEEGFPFWQRRISHAMAMYDLVRIDHFVGLVRYYAIPAEETTARHGEWRNAEGAALLELLAEEGARLIAEDLGIVTEDVARVRNAFGIPGMKVMQFAFEGDEANPFLPCHYEQNCVVYGGTHDNETTLGYFSNAPVEVRRRAARYLGIKEEAPAQIARAVLRACFASVADLSVMSMSDLLLLGNEGRINTPSRASGNWDFRLGIDYAQAAPAWKVREMTELYSRLP